MRMVQPTNIGARRLAAIVAATLVVGGCSVTGADSWRWSHVESGVEADLVGIDMRPNGSGTIVGVSGTILETTDHGRTWDRVTSPVTSDFTAVKEMLDGTAVAVTRRGEIAVRRNHDWRIVGYSAASVPLSAIAEVDGSVVVLGGGYELNSMASRAIVSTDGGLTWNADGNIERSLFCGVADLDVVRNRRIVAVGMCYPPGFCRASIVLFSPESTGVASIGLLDCPVLRGVDVREDGVGFAVGRCALKTSDHGASWTPLTAPGLAEANEVAASDSWVVVVGPFGVSSSTDQGQTWRRQGIGSTAEFFDVALDPDGSALVVGGSGTIVRWGG